MRERPILFSGPMVRALLAGTKTQTRRIMQRQPENEPWTAYTLFGQAGYTPDREWVARENGPDYPDGKEDECWCPYARRRGDRLWVRETWMDLQGTGIEHRDRGGKLQRYAYAADTPVGTHGDECRKDFGLKWRPSIHMPRVASRILLEVNSLRVERLAEISEADARAEGVEPNDAYAGPAKDRQGGWRNGYRILWEQINGPGSWDANPWVWAIEFKRITS
jgi:hypothetical protein